MPPGERHNAEARRITRGDDAALSWPLMPFLLPLIALMPSSKLMTRVGAPISGVDDAIHGAIRLPGAEISLAARAFDAASPMGASGDMPPMSYRRL